MERINLVELLRNCPSGMELDCTLVENLYFDCINDSELDDPYPIQCYTQNGSYRTSIRFTEYGHYTFFDNSKCVIFPKGKTTWEGFQRPFVDGDILSYQCSGLRNRTIYIYRHHPTMNTSYYVALGGDLEFMVNRKEGCALCGNNATARLATEKEKEKLFQAIKDKGYKWNEETKNLERFSVPKFKDGDIVTCKYENGLVSMMLNKFVNFVEVHYHCALYDNSKGFVTNNYIVGEPKYIHLATEEEKAKLFDAIKDNGYKWNAETKTLEKLPKFKDGDVVALDCSDGNSQLFIFKEYDDNSDTVCYLFLDTDGTLDTDEFAWQIDRLATEREKELLFRAIKDNGYKWNEETKTLEELVESKEDTEDKTVMSGIYFDREDYADEVELHLNNYEIEVRNGKTYAVFKNQETKTDKLIEPNFKVGDKVRVKNGVSKPRIIDGVFDTFYSLQMFGKIDFTDQDRWELVPNKFDINTLVPFESRVLARDNEREKWIPAFWGFYDGNSDFPYKLVGCIARYCIPYEGNEHLLGTTNDCDKFYRIWEKTRD